MRFWIGEGGENGTCAGSTIKMAMHQYSDDLYNGCQHFSHLAELFDNEFDIRMANTSCILFGVSAIEAKLNEWISISAELSKTNLSVWADIRDNHNKLPLQEKWNLIVERIGGTSWGSGKEPFQSYGLVVRLRNELVHYKGELLGKDEAPNKRITHIMKTLGIATESSFTDDDCSSWAHDLLNSKQLGSWVFASITPLWEKMFDLVGKEH